MSRKITIDPVTRVEGHGRVTIQLDDTGKVEKSRLHIVEFRGFERFIQGHPYWEVPVLVQRLCGICPVSHHLAASKAIDQLHGLDHTDLTPTTQMLRKLLHYGQIFQSHALHFFYLAAPDLLFGTKAQVSRRNVAALILENKELAKKGVVMRKFGQEIIRALAGKRIHGILAVPGGAYKTFMPEERAYFLNGKEIASIRTMIEWTQETLQMLKAYFTEHRDWLDRFAAYPSGHLGLVDKWGGLELYHGKLRAVDGQGKRVLDDVQDTDYAKYLAEGVEPWTYLKFPYLRSLGREQGWNRVGPLARLNICDHIPTPLAEAERKAFVEFTGESPNNRSMYYHWARVIEMLHCAELMEELLNDPAILGEDLLREGVRRPVGIGVVEAPRGTLIHHYEADEKGKVTHANLIVSTTHNNEAMNQAVHQVAINNLSGQPRITEGMLNEVEVAIRAYDPCLSCATHAVGQMPLHISLLDHRGQTIDEYVKS